MAGRLRHEGLVEDEVCLLEAVLDIAERPLVARLAERHLAVGGLREIVVGPFPDRDPRRKRTGRGRAHPDIALGPRIRAVRPQALDPIDDEGERFELDVDRFDRDRRRELVDATASTGSP